METRQTRITGRPLLRCRRSLVSLLVACSAATAWAAVVPFEGTVVDAQGQPLTGVAVRVKGENKGVVTDINGRFTLNVEQGKTLVLSYIGYSNQEIEVSDGQQMQIVLKEDDQLLDEVVVVGYGTAKKANLVGAVEQIDSKQIAERANSNMSR